MATSMSAATIFRYRFKTRSMPRVWSATTGCVAEFAGASARHFRKCPVSDGAHRLQDDLLLRIRFASLTLPAHEPAPPSDNTSRVRGNVGRVRDPWTNSRNVRGRGWPRRRYRLVDHADRDA